MGTSDTSLSTSGPPKDDTRIAFITVNGRTLLRSLLVSDIDGAIIKTTNVISKSDYFQTACTTIKLFSFAQLIEGGCVAICI